MTPLRVTRVVDHGAVSVVLSACAADAMIQFTERELTVTLSAREADALAVDLADAAEVRDGVR